jgi:hypothetical protein
MSEKHRATAREIAQKHLESGDPLGWFEDLYGQAGENASIIPWVDFKPNPNLIEWLDQTGTTGPGRALNIGSGLGDDAEELSRFENLGLKKLSFEEYMDSEDPPVRRFKVTYRRG